MKTRTNSCTHLRANCWSTWQRRSVDRRSEIIEVNSRNPVFNAPFCFTSFPARKPESKISVCWRFAIKDVADQKFLDGILLSPQRFLLPLLLWDRLHWHHSSFHWRSYIQVSYMISVGIMYVYRPSTVDKHYNGKIRFWIDRSRDKDTICYFHEYKVRSIEEADKAYFRNRQSSIGALCLFTRPRNGVVELLPWPAAWEGHPGDCVSAIWISDTFGGDAGAWNLSDPALNHVRSSAETRQNAKTLTDGSCCIANTKKVGRVRRRVKQALVSRIAELDNRRRCRCHN